MTACDGTCEMGGAGNCTHPSEVEQLRAALNELFGWMAVSGWTRGHRSGHERRTRTSLVTGDVTLECRCGESWPCPYIRAWRLATDIPATSGADVGTERSVSVDTVDVAHEVAEWHNNTGGDFEKWLGLYVGAIERAGFTITKAARGHACTSCGTTVPACDVAVHQRGRGCCAACYMRDTHGLLWTMKAGAGDA